MVHCPAGRRDFSFLQKSETGCGANPASYSTDAEALCLGVKRPCREANLSNEVKHDRRCTSSHTICLRGVVHRDSFASLFVAWLPPAINSFRPSTALVAHSFTFCLHTLLSRFFQMLEEHSKSSFFKVILRSITILRDFCCCYWE